LPGDSKQLPPTTFFAAADDDESAADEEASGTEGFESLLDTMKSLSSSYLDWHYRSREESLINFSNHYIYQGRLVTFPGPGGPPAISHVLVKQEFGLDGQEESSSAEVQAVVSLVLEHARRTPELTLGVITMGIRHMMRVQAAVDHALEEHPDLGAFFDPNQSERFFIKNLERVQGDERNAIINQYRLWQRSSREPASPFWTVDSGRWTPQTECGRDPCAPKIKRRLLIQPLGY
jgi:hypothetical protein